MQNQIYEMEGLSHANAVLTKSDYAVMTQLSQMSATTNVMHAHLKTLSSATATIPKRNINVGAAGEMYYLGENHLLPRKYDTNMRPVTRRDLGEAKRGANDG